VVHPGRDRRRGDGLADLRHRGCRAPLRDPAALGQLVWVRRERGRDLLGHLLHDAALAAVGRSRVGSPLPQRPVTRLQHISGHRIALLLSAGAGRTPAGLWLEPANEALRTADTGWTYMRCAAVPDTRESVR